MYVTLMKFLVKLCFTSTTIAILIRDFHFSVINEVITTDHKIKRTKLSTLEKRYYQLIIKI